MTSSWAILMVCLPIYYDKTQHTLETLLECIFQLNSERGSYARGYLREPLVCLRERNQTRGGYSLRSSSKDLALWGNLFEFQNIPPLGDGRRPGIGSGSADGVFLE